MNRLILVCVLAAAGCAHFTDMDSDDFDQGRASQEQFTADASACTEQGDIKRSYDVQGIVAEPPEKHAIFDKAFAACMHGLGYREKSSGLDIW